MDLEGIKLSEINQTAKDTYFMISLIGGVKKKKNELSDTENILVVARNRGSRAGKVDEVVPRCTPSAVKSTSHGDSRVTMVNTPQDKPESRSESSF